MASNLLVVVFFLLGAIMASFIGVITEHIYTGQSWLKGRSHCNSCRRTLEALDLVPIFSWLSFGGRCRTCGAKLPGSYVLSELSLGIFFSLAYVYVGLTLAGAVFLVILCLLLFIVLYDLKHMIVPWSSSIALIILCGIFALLRSNSISELQSTIITALIIGICFLLLHALSGGRAMGLGDAPVAFALSLLVGQFAVSGVLFSFWIGAVIGVLILVFRRGGPKMGIEVPFVPFLALGYLLAFFIQWNVLF